MRHGLKFYRSCIQEAWRGSWDIANAWPPTVGLLALYAGARLAGFTMRLPGDAERSVPAMAVLFVATAWLAVFLVRLVAAPPRIVAALEARLPAPVLPSALHLRLHGSAPEAGAVDAVGDVLPPARVFLARATNRGDALLQRCQLFFGTPTNIQVVSAPFDLAPGAHRDLAVLRTGTGIDAGADDPHALVYFLDRETWKVAQGQAAWLPDPGRFKVTALSADTTAAALEVDLSSETAEWTLAEAPATGVDTAPTAAKTGRQRLAWMKAGRTPTAEGFAPAND